jgi:HK97 family phage portal protein
MSIFGLMTQKEAQAAIAEAVKAAMYENMPKWVLETADAEQYNTDFRTSYEAQADLYRKLSWVTSACQITSQAAALARFDVKRVIQEKEPKDIPNHPFEMRLRRPNELDSRFEFLQATILFYMLNGNAYWWLNRESADAAPDEIWFIPPHMIFPRPDGRQYIKDYEYDPGNGRLIYLPPHEIVHFRRPNPFNRFVGMSAIESIAFVANGDLAMQQWNTKLFNENNARLPSVLAFSDMPVDTTWQKMKDDIREASKKREMMMLRGVGAGGVQWLQNAVSQREMEFLEGRKFNKEEIWSVLAPGLMSMLSENATEANSRTGRATFNELTVYPIHVLLGEKITNAILPAYGSSNARPLIGQFEDIRMTDRALELQEQERFAQTHTIAEIREEYYGHEPLGDERDKLLPAQINAQSGGIQEPPAPKLPPGQPGKPVTAPAGERVQEKAEEPQKDKAKAEAAAKAVTELYTWQNYSLKAEGRVLKFQPEHVPHHIAEHVRKYVPLQKSSSAVKAVFDEARRMAEADGKPKDQRGALAVLDGLRAALAGK